MLKNNWLSLGITFLCAIIWLRVNDFAAHRGWINSRISRKIIHIGTGPIYVLCWLLFQETPSARYLAALVPFMVTAQFLLIGAGIIDDQPAVDAMSRSGDRREILRGPLYYGIVFVILTIIYWRNSPIGIVALMLLCGGDGLADIIGSRWGKIKIPLSKTKSWMGSVGMFLGGWTLSVFICYVYKLFGYFTHSFPYYMIRITILAIAGMIIESTTPKDWDNITVPTITVILGLELFS